MLHEPWQCFDINKIIKSRLKKKRGKIEKLDLFIEVCITRSTYKSQVSITSKLSSSKANKSHFNDSFLCFNVFWHTNEVTLSWKFSAKVKIYYHLTIFLPATIQPFTQVVGHCCKQALQQYLFHDTCTRGMLWLQQI